ncbi:unnamed protein product [Chironomus riparius]|uniref:Ionotropic receptor n=1 Tax=Chironomus riparius TaxID=315576 RepID=A0A9N9RQ46_9DIPT|nr:unnamed protein product [Chironomus riparius]
MNMSLNLNLFQYFAILCLCSANPIENKTLLHQYQINNNILISSICKVANDIADQKILTQDILIGNLGGQLKVFDANAFLRCISCPAVISDLTIKMTTKHLRKASLVILAMNKTDVSSIMNLIKTHRRSTIWHHMAKIICVVSPDLSYEQIETILQTFFLNGHLNVVVVYESVKGIVYETFKPHGRYYKILMMTNPRNSLQIFQDKLKNLEGFEYQVASVNNLNNSYINSLMIHFFHAIKDQQNCNFKLLNLHNLTVMKDYWRRRKMHLLINVATIINSPEPTLMTYEEKTYCRLIPIPQKTSFVLRFIIKPFDRFIWISIIFSILCAVAVWRLFRDFGAVDSHWKVAIAIFMIFIGQGLNFSRRNRTELLILLHLISISLFILSNAYESVITSFMIDPGEQNLKTVKDLLESNFRIIVGEAFKYNFKNSSDFSSIINSLDLPEETNDDKNIIEQKYAFIRLCDVAKQILSSQRSNKKFWSEYYYILNERIPSQFIRLEASFLNPYLERFQYFMDLSFEAGLPQMWKVFESHLISKLRNVEIENDFLTLKDLGPVFLIVFIGCTLSMFVLLFEIFHYEFIRHISWSSSYDKCRTYFGTILCKMGKKPKINVNRIFVQPRESDAQCAAIN